MTAQDVYDFCGSSSDIIACMARARKNGSASTHGVEIGYSADYGYRVTFI